MNPAVFATLALALASSADETPVRAVPAFDGTPPLAGPRTPGAAKSERYELRMLSRADEAPQLIALASETGGTPVVVRLEADGDLRRVDDASEVASVFFAFDAAETGDEREVVILPEGDRDGRIVVFRPDGDAAFSFRFDGDLFEFGEETRAAIAEAMEEARKGVRLGSRAASDALAESEDALAGAFADMEREARENGRDVDAEARSDVAAALAEIDRARAEIRRAERELMREQARLMRDHARLEAERARLRAEAPEAPQAPEAPEAPEAPPAPERHVKSDVFAKRYKDAARDAETKFESDVRIDRKGAKKEVLRIVECDGDGAEKTCRRFEMTGERPVVLAPEDRRHVRMTGLKRAEVDAFIDGLEELSAAKRAELKALLGLE